VDGLAGHLTERYGIRVTGLAELDTGVYRVDGPNWVARVFPETPVLPDVAGDAELLRRLERGGFPAERCAHDEPVSEFAGRAVLVTGFVEGVRSDKPGRTFAYLGALLGRLHARDGVDLRPGGAWHHLASGTPTDEIDAALKLIDDHELLDEVCELDDCADLPHAFVHPDFVPANAITTPEDEVVIVDWAGAGRGPRLWSLGFLLWAAGMRSPKLVELVISRYRRHVTLEPDELSRLAGAVKARPLLIDCWSVAHGRKPAAEVSGSLRFLNRNAERIAAQAVALFTAPEPP
jgi:aminoglycoside phosphotransferase (APT) family kinase protein